MTERKELYEQGSQYLHWRFSKAELAKIRETNNKIAVERVKENLLKERELQKQSNNSEGTDGEDVVARAEGKYLTAEDELSLIDFYKQNISIYARLCRLPDQVKATAITFFKRFYVHNTVMDYNPKNVMATCVYLATKTENSFVQINDFIKPLSKFKITSEDVLSREFAISQSLQFEFAVHHPYKPSHGFYLDMQSTSQDLETLTQTFERTKFYIQKSLYTDACFHYMPSQIALAAWKLASMDTQYDIDSYLTSKFDAKSLNSLYQTIDIIQDMIKAYQPVQKDVVRDIDRRRHYTENPAKNPSSLLYKQIKEQEEKEEEGRETIKETKMEDDDVFS